MSSVNSWCSVAFTQKGGKEEGKRTRRKVLWVLCPHGILFCFVFFAQKLFSHSQQKRHCYDQQFFFPPFQLNYYTAGRKVSNICHITPPPHGLMMYLFIYLYKWLHNEHIKTTFIWTDWTTELSLYHLQTPVEWRHESYVHCCLIFFSSLWIKYN